MSATARAMSRANVDVASRAVASRTAAPSHRARARTVAESMTSSALSPSPDVLAAERVLPDDGDVKVVVFVPGARDSFMKYPPSLASRGRYERAGPSYEEVFEHLAKRVSWSDAEGAKMSMRVVVQDASEEEMRAKASDVDVAIAIGVEEDEVAMKIRRAVATTSTFASLESPSLETEDRICFQPTKQLGELRAKLTPWSRAAKDVRLMDQVKDLYARKNHLDALLLILLLVDASGARVPAVDINQDITLGNVWCIASNCNKQLMACYQNPRCRQSLDCVDACGLNDQVCTYTCIRSYQNPEFERLARCMLHKHNCLANDAKRPLLPEVLPMTTWRGEPMTHDAAERIMQGWLGEKKYSWLAVAGQNPAYDYFPNQFQLWYRGKGRNQFWYNPVFKVNTLDGRSVYRRSDYRCRRAEVPGTFIFTFMDNGVTSEEYWRIVDAADDLSWSLYYYAGAAKSAGQSYIGAVLATPDGLWPAEDQMERVEDSLWRGCGVKIWEMCQVDNSTAHDGDAPLEPLHEPVLMP